MPVTTLICENCMIDSHIAFRLSVTGTVSPITCIHHLDSLVCPNYNVQFLLHIAGSLLPSPYCWSIGFSVLSVDRLYCRSVDLPSFSVLSVDQSPFFLRIIVGRSIRSTYLPSPYDRSPYLLSIVSRSVSLPLHSLRIVDWSMRAISLLPSPYCRSIGRSSYNISSVLSVGRSPSFSVLSVGRSPSLLRIVCPSVSLPSSSVLSVG